MGKLPAPFSGGPICSAPGASKRTRPELASATHVVPLTSSPRSGTRLSSARRFLSTTAGGGAGIRGAANGHANRESTARWLAGRTALLTGRRRRKSETGDGKQGRIAASGRLVIIGAEHLAIGQLMRRNILAYKAPPNNQGYDLICIHPDPKHSTKTVRVQVKSRYQTDCDRALPVKEKTFGAFDYLIVIFLNIGYFYSHAGRDGGRQTPEFFTLPREFIQQHHYRPAGVDPVRWTVNCFRQGSPHRLRGGYQDSAPRCDRRS